MTGRSSVVSFAAAGVELQGELTFPDGGGRGVVVFAHGSGSSRHSPRNRFVAGVLQARGLATLLFDLLTVPEEYEDLLGARIRFDVALLGERLIGATDWVHREVTDLPVGYFGASTGAAAALIAAARRPELLRAVVSRGGRPDLAGAALPAVRAPTLLIVGGRDDVVIELNEQAAQRLVAPCELVRVPGATHLFEEPGALDQVARLAAAWFERHLGAAAEVAAARP